MKFTDLNLDQALVQSLDRLGYSQPTPIQQQSIPHILAGKDIFGCAQTGTGKTAAFALPILQLLNKTINGKKQIRALILAPTRELALQISASISAYSKQIPVAHTVIFGGVSQFHQVRALQKGVDILVATPGRLLDLMQQGHIRLNQVEFFVLDEADKMLDMGFIHDIKRVLGKLPVNRQTLFFSATASPEIKKLAASMLRNPVHVSVTPESSASVLVDQRVYHVARENKRSLLRHVLSSGEIEHALVFTRTKRGADKVSKELNKNGIKAEAIHGNKSQGARERALKGFKDRHIRVLVATDIASRGIDIQQLSHVINYEIPEQAETYVHRIGRTGRAGKTGVALSFCDRLEQPYLKDINRLLKKNIPVIDKHPFA